MVHMNNNQDNNHNNDILITYGWNSIHDTNFTPFRAAGYLPGRIIREGRGIYRAITSAGELLVRCSGTCMSLQELGLQPTPAIGDWCAISLQEATSGRIEAILPRQLVFHRAYTQNQPITGHTTKVVAANIDKAAIVQDAKYDFNIRRIERLQSLLSADGIPTILILTKADLLEDIEAYRRRIQTRFPDCPLYTIDNMSGAGAATLLSSLQSNSTLMLVGASGSGKSSLVNCLCHTEITKTAGVREKDGRGRHTTTTRHLYQLPNGALLIDTPGIRMVGMNSDVESIQNSFDDIATLATSCKFNDCHHRGEPGCAVQKALHDGSLEQDRYINYLRLTQEAQSWEEIVRQSKEKKKTIGKIRYRNRRSGGR